MRPQKKSQFAPLEVKLVRAALLAGAARTSRAQSTNTKRATIVRFSIYERHHCTRNHRHCFARARGGKSDSDLTRQLCNRSTPLRIRFTSFTPAPLRSDGHKLARQSEQLVRFPGRARTPLRAVVSTDSFRCYASWQMALPPASHRNCQPSLRSQFSLTLRRQAALLRPRHPRVALVAVRQDLRPVVEASEQTLAHASHRASRF